MSHLTIDLVVFCIAGFEFSVRYHLSNNAVPSKIFCTHGAQARFVQLFSSKHVSSKHVNLNIMEVKSGGKSTINVRVLDPFPGFPGIRSLAKSQNHLFLDTDLLARLIHAGLHD
jgi:hypothetical protein